MREELGFQQGRGTPPDTGHEPGRHPDPGQSIQHAGGPPDRKVMPAGQQRCQRGGLRADPNRASRTQRQRQHGIGGDRSLGGRSARVGHGLGGGRFPGTGLLRGTGLAWGTGLFRGAGGGTRYVTAGVHRAGHIGGGGVVDMPAPATPPRHQLVLGDLRWRRRLDIRHLATDPRGLGSIVQRLLTPGTVIRGDLERLIRVINQTPRRRRRTRLLTRLTTRPAPRRTFLRGLLIPRRIRRRRTRRRRGIPTQAAFQLDDPIRLLGDHPPLLLHHRLQLADAREQPLNQHLQRTAIRHTKIIPGYDFSTGCDTPRDHQPAEQLRRMMSVQANLVR